MEDMKQNKLVNQVEFAKGYVSLNTNKSQNKGVTRYLDSHDETMINFDISNLTKTDT